jgi:hypothetical protein
VEAVDESATGSVYLFVREGEGMRRIWAGLVVAAAVVAAVGCGGDGSATKSFTAPTTTVQRQASILGGDASAGQAAAYEPTGEIVADDGFRPWVDGFGFENYGNDAGPENMTPSNVEDIFGTQVCEDGTGGNTGAECQLIPTAAKWMEVENERMAGGHCMGFSVTANQFFLGVRDAKDYGGGDPYAIEVQGNTDLQSLIAENWTYQDLPAVQDAQVTGTPSEILQKLIDTLPDDKADTYTIAIFKRDGTAGHAVTPFAVEDNGDGTFHILVYDNNFPGIVRAIGVDTNDDTWSYVGGPDPSNTDELYEGDAETQSLSLFPNGPGDADTQPCPFCTGEGVDPNDPSTGSVLGASEQYDQISLAGDPVNHAHLVLKDAKGRTSGFVGGKIVNEIPGVRIQKTLANQNWNGAPEPTYLVPKDAEVTAVIDGSALTKTDKETITLIGTGVYAEVSDIVVEPNSENAVKFQGGEHGIIFHTDPNQDQAPIIASAIEEKGTFCVFTATALGVKGGSVLTEYFEEKSGAFGLLTEGSKGGAQAQYVLVAIRSKGKQEDTWSTDSLHIPSGQLAVVLYRKLPARSANVPVYVATADGKTITSSDQVLKPDNG